MNTFEATVTRASSKAREDAGLVLVPVLASASAGVDMDQDVTFMYINEQKRTTQHIKAQNGHHPAISPLPLARRSTGVPGQAGRRWYQSPRILSSNAKNTVPQRLARDLIGVAAVAACRLTSNGRNQGNGSDDDSAAAFVDGELCFKTIGFRSSTT
jgi:hypothetical protein